MKSLLNLDVHRASAWPQRLRPREDEDALFKEDFSDWWRRNYPSIAHLPQDLCEQWIYKHWEHSPFSWVPIEDLTYSRQSWSGQEVLKRAYRAFGGELDPEYDYKTFQRKGGEDRTPTALALDEGTWDYPLVLLSTPTGVRDLGEDRPLVRFVIVEGHQRHRYLNALHALDKPPTGPHAVIVLSSPSVAT